MPYFLGFLAYFQHFEPPLFLLPLILTINLSILFNFQLKSTATCLFCTMPINRTYFLEKPISFTLSSPLIMLAKHRPFSPSPPLLFTLSKPLTIAPVNSNIKLKLRPATSFNHIYYLPYLINTSIYICTCSARQLLL